MLRDRCNPWRRSGCGGAVRSPPLAALDHRRSGPGALRQPRDGAELDVPVDLAVDVLHFALRAQRREPTAHVAKGNRLALDGDVFLAGLEHHQAPGGRGE